MDHRLSSVFSLLNKGSGIPRSLARTGLTFAIGALALNALLGCGAAATVRVPVLPAAQLRAENVDYVAQLPEVYWAKHQARTRNQGLEMTAAIIGMAGGNNTQRKTGGDTSFEDSPYIAQFMTVVLRELSARHAIPFHDLRNTDERPEGHGVGIKMHKLMVTDERSMTANLAIRPRYTATVRIVDLADDKTLHEEKLRCSEHKIPDCRTWIAHAMSVILLPDVANVDFDLVEVVGLPALQAAFTSAEAGYWSDTLTKLTEAKDSGTQLSPDDNGALLWDLGIARFATGDCQGAKDAWDEAVKVAQEHKDTFEELLATMPPIEAKARCGVKVLSPDTP